MEISLELALKVSPTDNPVEKQEIASFTPSNMGTHTIPANLVRVFLREISPMDRVPVLERGCRKIDTTRCPESLLVKSCQSSAVDYSLGLNAIAPSVIPSTPWDNLSAFTIEEFLIEIRSFSGVRKRLSPSRRVNSLVFLESFA